MITEYRQRYAGKPKDFGRVAVLYGGLSAEREISLRSGAAVAAGLRNLGVDVIEIDLGSDSVQQIMDVAPDRAFIVLHGVGGEDGRIQAVLESLHIPYTGSDYVSSAIAMNKLRTKQIWQSLGLLTPAFLLIDDDISWQTVTDKLGHVIFVKPVCEGSSLGMSRVASREEFDHARRHAFQFDDVVIAESCIVGEEYTVALLNGVALPAIELKTDHVFYDYDAKYSSQTTEYLCPCGLNDQEEQKLRELALTAFHALGCSGWGRVDFMRDESGKFQLLEVNTVPGMTSQSLVPKAANSIGLTFDALVGEILVSSFDNKRFPMRGRE